MAARTRRVLSRTRPRGPIAAPPPPAPTAADHRQFVVPTTEAGHRLDVFLTRHLPGVSRSEIQRLIRSGHVTWDRSQVKVGAIVSEGAVINVGFPPPSPATPQAQALPLSILYDDEDVVVIDKPAGMVVHPAAGHREGTLVNALLHHVRGLSGVGGQERPGIVHRLDRGTSGLMVVAKHDRAHRSLTQQFHDRTVGKEYIALVWGLVRAGQVFDQPIGRDPRHRQKMSSRARRSRTASTQVISVEALGEVSLVHLTIGTGRTHQIRVHLSEAGHAVVGDLVYGGQRGRRAGERSWLTTLERPFLHASRLTFSHPDDGRAMSFEAPLADDLAAVLSRLRGPGQ